MTAEATPIPAPDTPKENQKLQFDYAWKWFNFHADQRIKMFNYMLVVFGVFAAGIVNALDKEIPSGAIAALCFVAAFLAFIFTLLDGRNRDLVWLGEDVLLELEREVIFGKNVQIDGRHDKKAAFAILWRQAQEEKIANPNKLQDAWRGKHRILLPMIGYIIAALFSLSGFIILCRF